LSVDSLMISFRTMFDAAASPGVTGRYELRFGDDRFSVEVSAGRFTIVRGEALQPDAVVETDPRTLAGVVYFGGDLDEAIASGTMRIEGNKAAAKKFFTLFTLPEPAPVPLPAA
jgi:alkyl sulfatase BDS1-like metallo-beta-lactamase superfamily hydrolase